MPKILHIITRLIRGGADENTILTIQGMLERNYEVDLIVGGESDPELLQHLKGVNVIVFNELVRDLNLFKDIFAIFKLCSFLRKNKYAIVHTHTAKAGIVGRLAAKMAGIPVVHTLHGVTFHEHIHWLTRKCYIFLEKLTAFCTDEFISVGEDVKEKYVSAKITIPEKIKVIRSGFDIESFIETASLNRKQIKDLKKEIGVAEDTFLIGCISRLEPRKGHIYLLDAVNKILSQHTVKEMFAVLLAGEGGYRSVIENKIKVLNLTGCVKLLGFRQDIAAIINLVDVVVLTSLWEGLPRVLVQAALLEKPIITFNVEGASEVVKQGENGYILSSKDTQNLARYLGNFILKPQLAREMGRKGKQIVTSDWDYRVMNEKIHGIYQALFLKHSQN